MLNTTFIKDQLALVVHEEGKRITEKILDDTNATFVWGELMDPYFIKDLLGHFAPCAPAVLLNHRRRRTKKFFNVTPDSKGGTVTGVVLLGLSKMDVEKLNEFEQVGKVMRRTSGTVYIGHYRREAAMYLKI